MSVRNSIPLFTTKKPLFVLRERVPDLESHSPTVPTGTQHRSDENEKDYQAEELDRTVRRFSVN